MTKELYLYNPIYSYVAESVVSQLEDNINNEVVLRVVSPGGSVFAAYGIYAKIKEHGNVKLKVDGNADSAASFLPLYANSTECLDVSRFTFHRADMYVENETEQQYLDGINKDLKTQMLKKIDADAWLEVTGISIDEMFDPKTRKDITITGVQAKKIGLVQKVNKLTPELQKEMAAFTFKTIEASDDYNKNSKITTMTKEEIQAKFPGVYAEIINIGVAQENDRVSACLVFLDADPKGVKAAIESKKALTATQMAEFSLAAVTKNTVAKVEEEAEKDVKTGEENVTAKTVKEKEIAAFTASLDARLGIKK